MADPGVRYVSPSASDEDFATLWTVRPVPVPIDRTKEHEVDSITGPLKAKTILAMPTPKSTTKRTNAVRLGHTLDFMSVVWALNHALERTSKKMESTVGLTAPQRMVLRIVGRFPDIAPARLAEILSVHPATLSVALKRLEGRGLIDRTPDPDDRRSVRLNLSPAGRWYDVPSDATVESAMDRALGRLTKAQVEVARKVLQTIVSELDTQDATAE